MSVAEAVTRVLELLAFAIAYFGFAAALRGWLKWPEPEVDDGNNLSRPDRECDNPRRGKVEIAADDSVADAQVAVAMRFDIFGVASDRGD